MTVLYSLLFSLTGTFLSQITPDNPLQQFHADRTLLSTSAPHPPVATIVDPKYLNELVHDIGMLHLVYYNEHHIIVIYHIRLHLTINQFISREKARKT